MVPANSTTGPMFLKDVYCTGTERTLLSCSSLYLPGISSCTHGSYVGVHCEGKVLISGDIGVHYVGKVVCIVRVRC